MQHAGGNAVLGNKPCRENFSGLASGVVSENPADGLLIARVAANVGHHDEAGFGFGAGGAGRQRGGSGRQG